MKRSSAAAKNAKQPAQTPVANRLCGADPELRHLMIQTAAYFLAEKRGFSDCVDPVDDWYEAEKEINLMLQDPSGMYI